MSAPAVRITISSMNDPDVVLRALREPSEVFFKDIPDIISFKSYRELGVYEVKIRLRRFLTVVIDTIHFSIKQEGDKIIYESLEPGKFKAVFSVSQDLGITRIHAEISYDAPLKGSGVDAAISNIFRKLLWNLDEKAPIIIQSIAQREKATAKEITAEKTPMQGKAEEVVKAALSEISCKTCLLYEASINMCTYLAKKIDDPGKPLCGGEKYIKIPT